MTQDRAEGNAMIEFVWLCVLLMVPLLYALLTVFAAQRGAFGITQAAREAGRALATADTVTDGLTRARSAVALALADQHVAGSPTLSVVPVGAACADRAGTAAASLAPGARFTVCVAVQMPLPYTDAGWFHAAPTLRLAASTLVTVDTYRSAP